MNFKRMILGIAFLLIAYALYCAFVFWRAIEKSAPIIKATVAYVREDATLTKNILVLGDSLAAGVGARSESSVAGRLAEALIANVANFGKSGAQTSDLQGQLSRATKSHYDLILIHAGANDVIQFKSLTRAAENIDRVLLEARSKSDRVVFLTSGDIGDAPLWPWPFNYVYSLRTKQLREHSIALAQKHGALYIDLYAKGDMFASDPARYYAADQLHLSADGYQEWFNVIYGEISQKWPDLVQ